MGAKAAARAAASTCAGSGGGGPCWNLGGAAQFLFAWEDPEADEGDGPCRGQGSCVQFKVQKKS